MVWIKRLAILIGVLLVLMVALVAYVMIFVNPNDFKKEIQKVALEKADVRLRMDGDIHWSFFPHFGLSLSHIGVALGKDPEILQFDRAEFGLAVLPLLKRNIDVDTVELVNLKANLSVDKQGHANWQRNVDGAKAKVQGKTQASKTNNAQSSQASSSNQADYATSASDPFKRALPNLHLDKLIIKNADITYTNAVNKQKVNAVMNVELSDVQWNKAWPLAMNLMVKQSDLQGKHPINAEVKLDADLTFFPEREAFSLNNVDLSTTASGDKLPTSPFKASLQASQVDMDVPQETLSAQGLVLKTLGMTANASVQAFQVLSDPEYNGKLAIAPFNPREVMKKLKMTPPNMSDSKALTEAQLAITLHGDKDTLLVQPMSLLLDGSKINASAGIDFSPLRWDINIAGGGLDLDRYLPPETLPSEKTASSSASQTPAAGNKKEANQGHNQTPQTGVAESSKDLIPVDLIRSLEGHLGVSLKNVIFKKMQLDKVALDATVGNGVVRVSPALIHLYQGQAEVKATLDVSGNTPRMRLEPKVSGVQIQPLLHDYMKMDKLRGTTFVDGELSAQGNHLADMMSSLQGDLLVHIKKGALVGMNITRTVCKGIAAVRKESINDKDFGNDTPFENMTFPARIVNGQISTPGLVLTSAGIRVTGDGIISLPKQALDYQANVALSGSSLDHACRVNDKITKLAFPIVCKGHFSDDPAGLCRPDLKKFGALFADLAKQELKDKVAAEKEKLKEKLKARRQEEEKKLRDKLKDKLKSLF
ncbi:putative assembly protein [Marinomonas spartinae]|uniref:Putative assembly protein n=1 Tax=Marinomonas spartinae TaxID=1792290 RepID=A0A1A8T4Q3_9GAMM|nr:AsmA family protein [Marinomonas spartinae]SBS26937.1 putative assembly protein [Marinomonas spartinae]